MPVERSLVTCEDAVGAPLSCGAGSSQQDLRITETGEFGVSGGLIATSTNTTAEGSFAVKCSG